MQFLSLILFNLSRVSCNSFLRKHIVLLGFIYSGQRRDLDIWLKSKCTSRIQGSFIHSSWTDVWSWLLTTAKGKPMFLYVNFNQFLSVSNLEIKIPWNSLAFQHYQWPFFFIKLIIKIMQAAALQGWFEVSLVESNYCCGS